MQSPEGKQQLEQLTIDHQGVPTNISFSEENLTTLNEKMSLYIQNKWKEEWQEELFISILDSSCFKLAIRSFIKDVVRNENRDLLERITNIEKAVKVYYSLHAQDEARIDTMRN